MADNNDEGNDRREREAWGRYNKALEALYQNRYKFPPGMKVPDSVEMIREDRDDPDR